MSKDERIAQLEARLALVEGRLAVLESRTIVYGPIKPYEPTKEFEWPTTWPNIVTCVDIGGGSSN